jgi:hypothetical protein
MLPGSSDLSFCFSAAGLSFVWSFHGGKGFLLLGGPLGLRLVYGWVTLVFVDEGGRTA